MKNILLVILAAMVLGAVASGCGHEPRYDSRLTAADSLLRDDPDSALAMLEALASDSSVARSDGAGGIDFSDADIAYHALLLTQARYKCYVTATSDSDINLALAYFRAHPADREKLTRAFIYKGAVMDELGHPDSAMFYYKTAEANAAPDDYFNLGYSNLRIAQLYQSHYTNDSAVVARMKIAASYFMAVNDTNYLITAIGTQGAYPKILGVDSACLYLKKAIFLAKKIRSPKGLQYQSKLAGIYYFNRDYKKAKELAMDIVRSDSGKCNESQFYYYAARSYFQLHLIDSACMVMSMIPPPSNAVDSFNHYQTLSELAKATRHLNDYVKYSQTAKDIDNRLMRVSRASKLTETELKCEASHHEKELKNEAVNHLAIIIGLVLLVTAILLSIAILFIRLRIKHYKNQLDASNRDLEKLISDIDAGRLRLETERKEHRLQLAEKDNELAEVNKKSHEQKQDSINKQVSSIVRFRLAALNELYQSIRITSVKEDGGKRSLLLANTVRELYEKKGILQTPPSDSFWNNLRRSVDGEYEDIVSFVEQNYPEMTDKDMHLFLLLCADFPNQLIKMCMNYTSDVTVSKRKKKLIKERFGLDVKLDEFIQMYLDGQLSPF